MSHQVRVLIADDHEVVREGLRMILEAEDGFVVLGEAADGAQAVELAGRLEPDVVLMDLRMPKMDGLEAIERIRAAWPQIAIVILTTYNEDDLMLRGLRAGARGFLLKDTSRQTLFDSLRAAARGEALLLPEVVERILAGGAPLQPPGRRPAVGSLLTARERTILDRVARGERNKEIAAALGITERTVKAHLSSIYNKLGVDSRAAAVAAAGARGLSSKDE
ncbi:MAG: DNA-binding response regulator [Chloroflexi bacterium RBG_13_68_17]|nr:MAG: DNA-binding response regulator [Chloroflexi bacterium RBG_13_68_17]